MVNTKDYGKLTTSKTDKSKTVSIRLPQDFPLSGWQIKSILSEFDNIVKKNLKLDDELIAELTEELLKYLKNKQKKIKPKKTK